MELGGISSAYAEYLQNQNTAETKLKETIDGTDYANATGDELLDACKQFEAYFLEQVFKEMEKQGLGIAQMLYEQMKRNYNLE